MSIFTNIQNERPRYSSFDLSHHVAMSLNTGELIPSLVMEMVPGDKFKVQTAGVIRMAPMLAPLMHKVTLYQHLFFVPNRLVWTNFEDFITGGEDGTADPTFPTVTKVVQEKSIYDYMGLPIDDTAYTFSAIPFAGYNKIYNEFYRDQNLISAEDDRLNDGTNSNNYEILRRAWQHDYLTSALPFTQKGPAAQIPIGEVEPNYLDRSLFETEGGAIALGSQNTLEFEGDGTTTGTIGSSHDGSWDYGQIRNLSTMTVGATTIEDLRVAIYLQEWYEKNARGGSRYIELILSHFGVKSRDARLQRPEFLGGGAIPVQFSEVLQTSSTDSTTPQGNMAGHGIGAGVTTRDTYRATEHGYLMAIVSVRPKTSYFQGVPKHFKKFDKFDFYWPSFANLGEQPIYNYEAYQDETDPLNDKIFGYTPRYAEYKYQNDRVAGAMRTTLDYWTWARKFDSRPTLSGEFVTCTPSDHIFTVQNPVQEQLYLLLNHSIKAQRPMPYHAIPNF